MTVVNLIYPSEIIELLKKLSTAQRPGDERKYLISQDWVEPNSRNIIDRLPDINRNNDAKQESCQLETSGQLHH